MSLTELLLDTALADTDWLVKNDALGDDFAIPRDVEFVLVAPDEPKAQLVRDFIDDNRYGLATVQPYGDGYAIMVVVHMAPQQNVLCSVSALMACISVIFCILYDGFSCELRPRT